jgi:hypothetical protein
MAVERSPGVTPHVPDDRPLFVVAAIGFAAIVLVGFAPSYYLRGLVVAPLTSLWVHAHALLMTAWVALFACQVWFVRSGNLARHRRMGIAGIVLATLICVVGFFTALGLGRHGSPSIPGAIPPLAFMIVPMADLSIFAGFVAAAVAFRRRPAIHKRLMLLSSLALLPPALARIPLGNLAALAPLIFFGLPALLALAAIVYDSVRQRRVNRAFVIGGVLLILSFPLRMLLMGTSGWMRAATWLVQFAPT